MTVFKQLIKNKLGVFFGVIGVFLVLAYSPSTEIFLTKTGTIKFVSDAPLERIEAVSKRLSIALNTTQRSIAISIPVISFEGFNSPLQKEHFHENYLESTTYPKGVFSGKIIEEIDLTKSGEYKIRVKGKLEIHGVEKERIISGNIKVTPAGITLSSKFEIPINDHEITVPKVVYQKISEVIKVEISADLKAQI